MSVELGVVERGQSVTTVRIFPYPVAERVLYELLLLLRKYGFISVQYALFAAAFIIHGVEYANILGSWSFTPLCVPIATLWYIRIISKLIVHCCYDIGSFFQLIVYKITPKWKFAFVLYNHTDEIAGACNISVAGFSIIYVHYAPALPQNWPSQTMFVPEWGFAILRCTVL